MTPAPITQQPDIAAAQATVPPAPASVITVNPPVSAPIVPATANPPIMEQGGTTGGGSESMSDFLKSMNWIEMGFMILSATALYYTIYYYRFKMKEDKVANSDTQRQLDEIKMNVQKAMKGKYQAI